MARLRYAALAALLLGGTVVYVTPNEGPASSTTPPLMQTTNTALPRGERAATTGRAEDTLAFARETAPTAWVTKPTMPTPLWLDAPYAALHLDPRAQIVQGEAPLPPVFDRTSFDALGLDAWISLRQMRRDLQQAVGGSHRLLVPADAEAEIRAAYLLPPLDTVADRARQAPRHVTRHAQGMYLSQGDIVRGHGTLLVEGDLVVEEGAMLLWDGLVLVYTDRAPHQLRVDLGGVVQIRGALAARQVTTDRSAWQVTLAEEMDVGLCVAMGSEALLYYDGESLQAALASLGG